MIRGEMAEYNKSVLALFAPPLLSNLLDVDVMLQGQLKLGAPCSSGPFGGDAQLAAEIAAGRIGCLIFFVDPLSAHPHNADVECLLRLARVHEILLATNEMTAYCIVEALRAALSDSKLVPKSMTDANGMMSDSVAMYKKRNSVDRAAKESGMKDPSNGTFNIDMTDV